MGKIIISILLILFSLQSHSQMPIFYGHNQMSNLFLDNYPSASVAYSLRKLKSSYSGNCITVRRSSDNATQDIGFDGSGFLDTSSIKTFVGSSSGYVSKWYDQSGNARDMVQATAGNQPRIINAGVVERKNGKVSIRFIAASNTGFFATTSETITSYSFFLVYDISLGGSDGFARIVSFRPSGVEDYVNYVPVLTVSAFVESYANSAERSLVGAAGLNYGIGMNIETGSSIKNSANNLSEVSYSYTLNLNIVRYSMGVASTSGDDINSANFNGYIYEAIGYASDKSSNRIVMRDAINSYYQIF